MRDKRVLRRKFFYSFERLERRDLLSVSPVVSDYDFASGLGYDDPHVVSAIAAITTTNSQVPIHLYGIGPSMADAILPSTAQSQSLINLDDFRSDVRFAGIDGSGFSAVILDTGIDLNHPFFGPDSNGDGVADRIVHSHDFADNDTNASDVNGHGSNVSSIIASSNATHTGMAPGADIIHLKVFTDAGGGNFGYIERALQWVVANTATFNIASVNMSLGDSNNFASAVSLYGVGDEIAALAALDVIVVSASGNSFFNFNSAPGVSYPAADPNSLSVGAVFDGDIGGIQYGSGAIAFSTGPGRITPFSQRHSVLTDVMAPGAAITGANQNGGTVTQHGTSQASPHIAGIAVLAQQLANDVLGRRLSLAEYRNLLRSTSGTINDGDDENDNVINTNLNFPLVDVFALGQAISAMAGKPIGFAVAEDIVLPSNSPLEIRVTYSDNTGIDVSDLATGDIVVTGPNGFSATPVFQGVDINTDGTPRIATYFVPTPGLSWESSDNGTYSISIVENEVADIEGNFISAGVIGDFAVDIAPELGPDGFGYFASAAPYEFVDIASSGALILSGADDAAVAVAPGNGFEFNFYGVPYQSLFVNSNGLLTFGSGTPEFVNTDLTSSPSQPTIAAYWDDLHAPTSAGVYWQLIGAGDRQSLVIQWETRFWSDTGSISFQAILNEYDQSVRLNYRDLIGGAAPGEGGSATVGMKDSGTQGANRLVAVFNQAGTAYSRSGRSLDFHRGNRAPFGLDLSTDSVAESSAVGDAVAHLLARDYDLGDTHTFALVSGIGDEDNATFAILGDQLLLAAPLDFESKSTLSARIRVTDALGLDSEAIVSISVLDAPELVSAPVWGDGTQQRSLIQQVSFSFDGSVVIDSNAFLLERRGPNGGVVATTVHSIFNTATGQTDVRLTFAGEFVRGPGNALLDGYYQLTLFGEKIHRDAVAAKDFVIGDEEADGFFALYSDTNGDGLVGIAEFGGFRSTFGKTPSQAGYNPLYDFDGSGVGIIDFGQFRNRFGKPKLPWQ